MNLPKYQNCVGDWRFFLGSLQDYSGNNNDGTFVASPHFTNIGDGLKGLRFTASSDMVSVPDSVELQLNTGTLITYGRNFQQSSRNGRWVCKYKAAANYFDWFSNTNNHSFSNGTVTSVINYTYTGADSLAVSFDQSVKPKFYFDGRFQAEGSLSMGTWTTDDAALQIGNVTGGGGWTEGKIAGVLMFNVVLTDEEIAQVHEWIMVQKSPSFQKKNFEYPSLITGEEANLVAGYNLESIHDSIADKSGSGHTMTPYHTSSINGLVGKAQHLNGTDAYLSIADSNDFSFTDGSNTDEAFSVEALIKMDDATSFPIISKGVYNTSGEWRLLIDASDKIHFQCFDESVADCYIGRTYDTAITSQEGKWLHVIATYDATEASSGFNIYLNGVASDDTNSESNQGSYVGMENLTSAVHIGRDDTTYAGGAVNFVRVYDSELSQTEITNKYNEVARLPYLVEDLEDANVSVANNSGAGNYLENTNWKISTGAWKIETDDVFNNPYQKVITCVTAGILYTESQLAYGTFEFNLYKGGAATEPDIAFVADTIGARDSTGQDGYSYGFNDDERLTLWKSVAGTPGLLIYTGIGTVVVDTWYRIRITRRYDGLFSIWIKGGIYTDWENAGTITNSQSTTSKYIVFALDAADKVSDIRFYSGVRTP